MRAALPLTDSPHKSPNKDSRIKHQPIANLLQALRRLLGQPQPALWWLTVVVDAALRAPGAAGEVVDAERVGLAGVALYRLSLIHI